MGPGRQPDRRWRRLGLGLPQPDPVDVRTLPPPLSNDQLCALLTPAEITAIQGWSWEPADTPSSGGCAYGAVDLHTGAYIRLTNTTLTRDEFLGYYPTAQQFEGGLLIAASDQNGHLDDFWIALNETEGLHLEFFATRLTEKQAYQLVEALFS